MTDATEQMEKVTQTLIQACNEMNAMTRESVSAVVQSTSIAARGCEELTKNIGDLLQDSFSRTISASKTILAAKTVQELMDAHAEFLKGCFESWMSRTGQISEISARTTKEAIEPVASHVNSTMNKVAQQAQATHAQAQQAYAGRAA